LFDVTNNETITKTNIDKGKPINTGCRPKGCPAICQITATINPVHMDNTPASFVALFQNRPNNTGASKPRSEERRVGRETESQRARGEGTKRGETHEE